MLFNQGHALIIGVGADLPNTVDDAQGLAEILKDEGRCAYPPDQVHTHTGENASCEAILITLDQLAQSTDPQSTAVVYFSGHGYQVSSSFSDAYFLLPHGYDLERLKATAISGAEFTAKLRAIPAQKVLVLLDCCHAGGTGEAKAPHIEALTKSPLPPEATELLAEGHGRVLIASSQEDELSFAGKPYSAFTLALIEVLSGEGVAKKDGVVRVSDLALHTRQVVPGRTKDRQHPILHFEHADNFVLAYYAGGDTQPKGLPFPVESVEIEPEPGAWRGQVSGSGALAQGDHATALGERAVQVSGDVGRDVVTGDRSTVFDQRGQRVGAQTNVAGDVQGPVLSGQFGGPVATGGGEAVDMRGSQGALYKPGGPVEQQFGDRINVTGDGNVIGDHSRSTVIKQSTPGATIEEFLKVLGRLRQIVAAAEVDPDVTQVIESDLQTVEAQARKPKPNAALISLKLRSVAELLATADGVWSVLECARPLAQRALEWAGQLF